MQRHGEQKAGSGTTAALIIAILASMGASMCCIGPFLLLLFGIGGSWASLFMIMDPYRGWLVSGALLAMLWAFKIITMQPVSRASGMIGKKPKAQSRQRTVFWVVAGILMVLLTFPYTMEYLAG